jgi:hypothetical protein
MGTAVASVPSRPDRFDLHIKILVTEVGQQPELAFRDSAVRRRLLRRTMTGED